MCFVKNGWQIGVLPHILVSLWWAVASAQPNIVVEDNVIAGNGLGIYLGWGGDWFIQVTGNEITGNGEGIRIVNRRALIEGNLIAGNVIGLSVTAEHEEKMVTRVEEVVLRGNLLQGNELYAVQNLADIRILAEGNWWGSPEGPRWADAPASSSGEWLVWVVPDLKLDYGLTLDLSLTSLTREVVGLSLGIRLTGESSWARWNPASWGLALPQVMFIPLVSGARGTRTNLVSGLLQCEGWLRVPERGGK